MNRSFAFLILLDFAAFITTAVSAADDKAIYPVAAVIFVENKFGAAEGQTFSGEGKLFITADRSVWEISPDGEATRKCDVHTNVGVAGFGERDILVADFGPTNFLKDGENDDGIIWRITPEGVKEVFLSGLADPNFILVQADSSLLISDDFTNKIWQVSPRGEVTLFTDLIHYPNGMVFSKNAKSLYVAQIFSGINPVEFDNKLWRLDLKSGQVTGLPVLAFETGGIGANDGLAIENAGRIYIAANREGRIWRFNPISGKSTIIAENLIGVASIAFGVGRFDPKSIYATQGWSPEGGGTIWRVPIQDAESEWTNKSGRQ